MPAITNRVRFQVAKQPTRQTRPATSAFFTLRTTGGNPSAQPQTTKSGEIESDRNVTDLLTIGQAIGGPLMGELLARAYDPCWESLLYNTTRRMPECPRLSSTTQQPITNTHVTGVAVGGVYNVYFGSGNDFKVGHLVKASGFSVAANNAVGRVTSAITNQVALSAVVTATESGASAEAGRVKVIGFAGTAGELSATATGLASTALDFTTLGLRVGQWVKVGGDAAATQFATAANNDWCRIGTIAAAALTWDVKPAGWAVDSGASKTLRCYVGEMVWNGTAPQMMTLERSLLDVGLHEVFTDLVAATGSIDLPAQSLARVQFGLMGAGYGGPQATAYAAVGSTLGVGSVPLNTTANMAVVYENGVAVTGPGRGPNVVVGLALAVQNNVRVQPELAVPTGIGGLEPGECDVTGTLRTYFGDSSLYAKLYANQATSVATVLRDATGGAVVLDLPRLKYASGAPETGATNQDVPLDLPFQALRHPTLGYALSIQTLESVGA